MSTFHGLEMARQALFAQQSALYTTGHNIANANTEGYSRQRVNFTTMPAYPAPGRNQPQIPGQMGTGVQIGAVQRIRDQFLDLQFRAENSRSGYWSTRSEALSRMEALFNEPSDSGLSETLDQFWQSLQDLAVNPENSGARSVVAQRGLAVAETFNYLSNTLHSIQNDLQNQIDNTVDTANSLLRQIHNINYQIRKIEPHGNLANDLYDDRDRLIDELSKIMSIKVTKSASSPSSPEIADGVVTIELVDLEGNSFDLSDPNDPNAEAIPIILLHGHGTYDEDYFDTLIEVDDGSNPINEIKIKNTKIDSNGNPVDDSGKTESTDAEINSVDYLNTSGSLAGLMRSFGYTDGTDEFGDYPEMIADLDEMAYHFAVEFNKIHHEGYNLNGENNNQDFFVIRNYSEGNSSGAAANITVEQDILNDPNLIAASDKEDVSGNGEKALELARLFSDVPINNLKDRSIKGFYESLIGELGVKAQEANRMTNNTEVLLMQVDHQRMSISAVSLDEEMSNMIKFQHAYNAAARSMTAIDEMLDRIINGMGLVGR